MPFATHLLHDASLALGEGDVSPRLILNEFDLDFPTAGLLVLLATFFFLFIVAAAVDGIVVLDEGVVADGREAVVPGVGTRTLILSRRGCDGIRHVVMEDEKGKSNKVSKERRSTRGLVREKKSGREGGWNRLECPPRRRERERKRGRGGERDKRKGRRRQEGDERTMGWRGRGFWNGKLFLVGRRRPSWAKKEQAIYISKEPSLESHFLMSIYGKSHRKFHSPTQFGCIRVEINLLNVQVNT